VDVILDAIQSGAARRVEAPTRRKDITPVALEPDFVDQEDEPEITLPEGYDENDFDERRKIPEEVSKVESKEVSKDKATEEEKPTESENQESLKSQEEEAPAEEAPAEEAPAEEASAEETAKS